MILPVPCIWGFLTSLKYLLVFHIGIVIYYFYTLLYRIRQDIDRQNSRFAAHTKSPPEGGRVRLISLSQLLWFHRVFMPPEIPVMEEDRQRHQCLAPGVEKRPDGDAGGLVEGGYGELEVPQVQG